MYSRPRISFSPHNRSDEELGYFPHRLNQIHVVFHPISPILSNRNQEEILSFHVRAPHSALSTSYQPTMWIIRQQTFGINYFQPLKFHFLFSFSDV